MDTVKQLLTKLTKFYWSANIPETYVILGKVEGTYRGVGIIAHTNYAAFNLAWAKCLGKWETVEHQRELVKEFARFQALALLPWDGGTVGDYATLLDAKEFQLMLSSSPTDNNALQAELVELLAGFLKEPHAL